MATEILVADAILVSSNYTSLATTDIDDDPDSPDGLWGVWDGNGNTTAKVSFPTPTGDPTTGTDIQNFRVHFRADTGSGSNSADWSIELWENIASVSTQVAVLATGSATGSVTTTATWNASLLTAADGSNVEFALVQTGGGTGSPTARRGLELGAVEWNVDYSTTTDFDRSVAASSNTEVASGVDVGVSSAASANTQASIVGTYAAAGSGDVRTAIVDAESIISGGPTQDITVSGFGTVKAYIVVCSWGLTDATDAANFLNCIGFSDGTTQVCSSNHSHDAVATSVADRWISDSNVVMMSGKSGTGHGVDGIAQHSAFITDGVRITWPDFASTKCRLQFMFFGGDDIDVEVGYETQTATINNTQDTTLSGAWQPDAILTIGTTSTDSASPNADSAEPDIGGASGTVQGVVGAVIANAKADADSNVHAYNDRIAPISWNNPGSINRYLEFDSFLSTGFRTTKRVGSSTIGFGWLAFKSTTNGIFAGIVASPSGSGNQGTTGIGFKPQAVAVFASSEQTINSLSDSGDEPCALSAGFFDGTRESSVSARDDDGLTTTVSKSRWDTTALYMEDGAGTVVHDASFVSFDTDGFTLNYANTTTARQWFVLAFEESGGTTDYDRSLAASANTEASCAIDVGVSSSTSANTEASATGVHDTQRSVDASANTEVSATSSKGFSRTVAASANTEAASAIDVGVAAAISANTEAAAVVDVGVSSASSANTQVGTTADIGIAVSASANTQAASVLDVGVSIASSANTQVSAQAVHDTQRSVDASANTQVVATAAHGFERSIAASSNTQASASVDVGVSAASSANTQAAAALDVGVSLDASANTQADLPGVYAAASTDHPRSLASSANTQASAALDVGLSVSASAGSQVDTAPVHDTQRSIAASSNTQAASAVDVGISVAASANTQVSSALDVGASVAASANTQADIPGVYEAASSDHPRSLASSANTQASAAIDVGLSVSASANSQVGASPVHDTQRSLAISSNTQAASVVDVGVSIAASANTQVSSALDVGASIAASANTQADIPGVYEAVGTTDYPRSLAASSNTQVAASVDVGVSVSSSAVAQSDIIVDVGALLSASANTQLSATAQRNIPRSLAASANTQTGIALDVGIAIAMSANTQFSAVQTPLNARAPFTVIASVSESDFTASASDRTHTASTVPRAATASSVPRSTTAGSIPRGTMN